MAPDCFRSLQTHQTATGPVETLADFYKFITDNYGTHFSQYQSLESAWTTSKKPTGTWGQYVNEIQNKINRAKTLMLSDLQSKDSSITALTADDVTNMFANMLLLNQIAHCNDDLYRHVTSHLKNVHNPSQLGSITETLSTQGKLTTTHVNLQTSFNAKHNDDKKSNKPRSNRLDKKCTGCRGPQGWYHTEKQCFRLHPNLLKEFQQRKERETSKTNDATQSTAFISTEDDDPWTLNQ